MAPWLAGDMRIKHAALIGGVALGIALGGVGVANAVGGDDDGDGGATGPGADHAKAAALAIIPGGTVNAVEQDDEKGATWEVEVRKSDGSTVDVRLDAAYGKVAVDDDSEAPDAGG
jgi:peptidase YpeB-like protein